MVRAYKMLKVIKNTYKLKTESIVKTRLIKIKTKMIQLKTTIRNILKSIYNKKKLK